MSNADAAWLHMDRPENLMVVNSLMWFDEPLDLDRMREVLRTRLVDRFPRFRQRIAEPRLGVGVPSWEDDPHFDLERHVHLVACPAPGDRASLERMAADLMTVPLDRSRPLWDCYVVEGFGMGVATIFRMHHCIADGIALSRVLLSLTDEQRDAGFAEAEAEHAHRGPLDALTAPVRGGAHLADAALHESFELLAHPGTEAPNVARRAAADARALGKLLLTGSDRPSVLRGKLGVTRRVTWSAPIPLEEVRTIGHATGTTVNDVLVAATAGALHRHLSALGDDITELRAMVPFNLRPLDRPLPRELGNRFGLVYLGLPVGEATARQRLAEVHRRMDAIKHSPEGPISYGILGAIGLTPAPIESRMIDVFTPKATLVLTNVPGPRQPVYFAGARVRGVIGWVPAAGNIGLGVSIFSYDGDVTIGVRSDAGLVPEPRVLVEGIEIELRALRRLRRPVADAAPVTT
jgi:diacylglycerol O-acyltransferase / wax synthase